MQHIVFFLFILIVGTGNSQTTKWKVIWNQNPEDDIKEYIVFRDYDEIGRVQSPDTIFVDTRIKPGILYSYRIKAVNQKNLAGEYSDPATAAIPGFKDLPDFLGISKNNPVTLSLKKYINDPDDKTHQIKRINIPVNSKISVSLESGNLKFSAKDIWTEKDSEIVEIEVKDSHEFCNIAKFVIKDENVIGEFLDISSLNIKIFPEEFSLNQFSDITFSNIPKNSNISIYDSFGSLVYSEKNISGSFEWDAENDNGDQVLFGLYNFVLSNRTNKVLFKGSFRVIP